MISETPTPLKQNRPLKIRLQRVSRMVGYPTLRIFLSFAINPVIAFGTPRDKQTNLVPARCAATEGNRQHSPARTFKPSVLYFPSRQTTPRSNKWDGAEPERSTCFTLRRRLSTGDWTGIPRIIQHRRISRPDPQVFAGLVPRGGADLVRRHGSPAAAEPSPQAALAFFDVLLVPAVRPTPAIPARGRRGVSRTRGGGGVRAAFVRGKGADETRAAKRFDPLTRPPRGTTR